MDLSQIQKKKASLRDTVKWYMHDSEDENEPLVVKSCKVLYPGLITLGLWGSSLSLSRGSTSKHIGDMFRSLI